MKDIYEALTTHLTSSTIANIDTASDIAYDNADFDPLGKSAWLHSYFIPVLRGTEAKDSVGITDTGLFQIDVFVPANDETSGIKQYNLRALETVDSVLNAFSINTKITYNQTIVTIGASDFAAPLISESWYQIPITINYTRI